MIQSIRHAIGNTLPTLTNLPKGNKISWKALAILMAFGTFLSLVYYLHPSRVSIKKADEPVAPTLKQTRIAKYEKLIKKQLLLNQYLGEAIDNGDCFYDALAKALKQININRTSKQLRNNISNNLLMDPEIAKNIENTMLSELGIDSFENYKKYVQYTADELSELRKTDLNAPDPYWGNASREGLILYRLYHFNLRIISAGCLENIIEQDEELKRLQSNHEANVNDHPQADTLHENDQTLINARLKYLYDQDNFYYTGDETYPKEVPYQLTCTLALYENHFVPVLTKA